MKLGNASLVEYGIWNDDSDLRVHVCVVAKTIYLYKPDNVREILRKKDYREGKAYTGKILTGVGRLVPPGDIPECRSVSIPDDLLSTTKFDYRDNFSTKGRKAEYIVRKMIERGLIPEAITTIADDDFEGQTSGSDIIPVLASIQVKCDWRGGHRSRGGTGNLFIQEKEANPTKSY